MKCHYCNEREAGHTIPSICEQCCTRLCHTWRVTLAQTMAEWRRLDLIRVTVRKMRRAR